MIRLALGLLFALSLAAQKNLDFESGSLEGWFAPPAITDFKASFADNYCAQGKGCAEITPTVPSPSKFGNLMQMIEATPYRGKRVRFRAAVSTNGNAHAQLWFRVDLVTGGMGFFENMQATPIRTQGQWQHFEINGLVDAGAKQIAIGVMALNGPIRIDDASFTVTGELPVILTEGPRPVTPQGLRNLEAFATLFGLIRHFHPSAEAASADWNLLAVEGARKVESATDLAAALTAIFQPVAPSMRLFTGEPPSLDRPSPELALIRLQHRGFGQGRERNTYQTTRIPAASYQDHIATLPGGLKVIFPLTMPKTFPAAATPLPAGAFPSADRATRLGAVIIAWNILHHFYPYFDIAQTDWNRQLPLTLTQAAIDSDPNQFQSTLRKMVAALKDGHGNVYANNVRPQARAPLSAIWTDNKLILTEGAAGTKPGDEVVAINGVPAATRLAEIESEISTATPQWARSRSAALVFTADRGTQLTLTIKPFGASASKEVTVTCDAIPGPSVVDRRPSSPSTELEPGVWYADLTRLTDKEWEAVLPQFAKATGIVFDMRGYPRVSPVWLSHVSLKPLKSAQWHIPLINRPGHMEFTRGGEWDLQPKAPYLEAKKIFLTNGGAISYAESTMGIVEAYKLGPIIGQTTAGTNGNVNPFTLPGGFNVTWTGMKVLKHDGTRHHGVGIEPTIPLEPTQAGIAAGRDELLERAVAECKKP